MSTKPMNSNQLCKAHISSNKGKKSKIKIKSKAVTPSKKTLPTSASLKLSLKNQLAIFESDLEDKMLDSAEKKLARVAFNNAWNLERLRNASTGLKIAPVYVEVRDRAYHAMGLKTIAQSSHVGQGRFPETIHHYHGCSGYSHYSSVSAKKAPSSEELIFWG